MSKQIIIICLALVLALGGWYGVHALVLVNKKPMPTSEKVNNITNIVSMKISSPNFIDNGFLPAKYTCDGLAISPALNFSEIPVGAKSLALIVEDPDAPSGVFTHWLVWNIPAGAASLSENSLPAGAELGWNDYDQTKYGPPCPPNGVHRYVFKVYALDLKFDGLSPRTDKNKFLELIKGHILAQDEITAKYSRN